MKRQLHFSPVLGFTKGKSCSTNLVAFYDGITSWVDGGGAVDVKQGFRYCLP